MRKYLFTLFLCTQFVVTGNSQYIDQIIQRKVDSLKELLPSAKGTARVDMLNSIAQGLLWIWEDNDQYQRDALNFADEALKLSTKLKYKRGLGYSLNNLYDREAHQAEKDTINNYKTDSHFQKAIAITNRAIKIGEELQDDILIGAAYNNQKYIYTKGKREDYILAIQKSIDHYERALKQNWNTVYTPLKFTDCDNCLGIEFTLGSLYRDQANLRVLFKDETVQLLRKSISYYEKANANRPAGDQYLQVARTLEKFNDIRTAIAEAKKALPFYSKDNNGNGEFEVYEALCGFYYELGDMENGLLYSKKAVRLAESLAKEKGDFDELNYPGENEFLKQRRLFNAYYWIGRFYSLAGDYENAFSYFRKASVHNLNKRWSSVWTSAMGNLHRLIGNYDSALFYFNPQNARVSLVRLFSDMKQYDKSIQMFNEAITVVTNRNNVANMGRLHAYVSKAYSGKKEYTKALSSAIKADALFKTTSSNLERIDNYQQLSDIYQHLGKFDSAYIFLKQYNSLKDSVLSRQFYIRLNDYKKEAEEANRIGQIKLLQKDNLIKEQLLQAGLLRKQQQEIQLDLLDKNNELKDRELMIKDQRLREQLLLKEQNQTELTLLDKENRLKDQQLNQQATFRKALLGGLLLFLLLGVFVYRNLSLKRKNERLSTEKGRAELQQKVAELEMQALRAQMNPHFIFNCLSSINRFIFKNDNKVASDYLTRFSRLIRMVLIHSQKKLIPLEDELEMIRIYLDLERLRFKDAFDYSITTTNIADPGTVFIPPLLLQPFCENAVWHGLMHKEEKGHLNLIISEVRNGEDSTLQCVIEDDGVGREKAAAMNSKSAGKEKSLGLKITKERLALLNQEDNFRTFYQIDDIMNDNNEVAGTRVQLKIKHKETTEEYA